MTEDEAFQQALQQEPQDLSLRLIYADWLDERGDPRGELLRLLHTLNQAFEVPDRTAKEARLRALLTAGVQAVGPFVTNTLGMSFAWIPPGRFLMGSPASEAGRYEDEAQHRVQLTRGFFLGAHQVTQRQWEAVMGSNPSHFQGDSLPVDTVSWDDCQEFCRRLSQLDGKPYRLPTEAEWEYACRTGTTTPFYFGDTLSKDQANHNGEGTTRPGSYPPNAFGLYDMHGNVWEWCQDWYGDYQMGGEHSSDPLESPAGATGCTGAAAGSILPTDAGRRPATGTRRRTVTATLAFGWPSVDPVGPASGSRRVRRGGSWMHNTGYCRAAFRLYDAPDFRSGILGFRIILGE